MKIRVINQNIHCLFFYVPPVDLTFVGDPYFILFLRILTCPESFFRSEKRHSIHDRWSHTVSVERHPNEVADWLSPVVENLANLIHSTAFMRRAISYAKHCVNCEFSLREALHPTSS